MPRKNKSGKGRAAGAAADADDAETSTASTTASCTESVPIIGEHADTETGSVKQDSASDTKEETSDVAAKRKELEARRKELEARRKELEAKQASQKAEDSETAAKSAAAAAEVSRNLDATPMRDAEVAVATDALLSTEEEDTAAALVLQLDVEEKQLEQLRADLRKSLSPQAKPREEQEEQALPPPPLSSLTPPPERMLDVKLKEAEGEEEMAAERRAAEEGVGRVEAKRREEEGMKQAEEDKKRRLKCISKEEELSISKEEEPAKSKAEEEAAAAATAAAANESAAAEEEAEEEEDERELYGSLSAGATAHVACSISSSSAASSLLEAEAEAAAAAEQVGGGEEAEQEARRPLGFEGREFGKAASDGSSFHTETDEEEEEDDGEREDDSASSGSRAARGGRWRGQQHEDTEGEGEQKEENEEEEGGGGAAGAGAGRGEGGEGKATEEERERERYLLAALGELPPDFLLAPGVGAVVRGEGLQGDQALTDLEEAADMDPTFHLAHDHTGTRNEGMGRQGRPDRERASAGAKDTIEEEGEEEGEEEEEQEAGAAERDSSKDRRKRAGERGEEKKQQDKGEEEKESKENGVKHDGVLTVNQRASVSELFAKKAPERVEVADVSRKLAVTLMIVDENDFPIYQPCEEASWRPHRAKLLEENRQPGIKAHIVRTETRGPKSAMYTTYVIHVKTAFHLRGVSRRFSDFSTLDRKLRAQYPHAPELAHTHRILGTLSPGFVQERREQLQDYLHKLISDHQLASSATVRTFLALNNIPVDDSGGARDPFAEKPWSVSAAQVPRLLVELRECRTAIEAPRETRLLNQIGLCMCEMNKQAEGLVYLQRAVSSARLSRDRRALLACLRNSACAHFRFGGHSQAIELLEEAVEIAQRLGDARLEASCLRTIALVHAAGGEMSAALSVISSAVDLSSAEGDTAGVASARFSQGVIKYETGDAVGGVGALEESLALRSQLKDKLGIAEVLNRLGLALIDIAFHLQALDYLERALQLCQEMGDTAGEAATLRLLAYVHLAQVDGNRSISLDLFRKSLSLSRRSADLLGQATCREGIGDVLMDMDDAKAAVLHYTQALTIRERATATADIAEHKDPLAVTRHLQLLRSKVQRAKAQLLENALADEGEGGGHSEDDGEGGDFLWRNHGVAGYTDSGASGSDNDLNTGPPGHELDTTPLKESSNIEFLQQQLATAMTSGAVALTKLWS